MRGTPISTLASFFLTFLVSAAGTVPVPGTWEATGHDHDGFAWYRCYVKAPDKWVTEGSRNLWVQSVTLKVQQRVFGPLIIGSRKFSNR